MRNVGLEQSFGGAQREENPSCPVPKQSLAELHGCWEAGAAQAASAAPSSSSSSFPGTRCWSSTCQLLHLPWQWSPLSGFGLSQAHKVMKSKRCRRRQCCQERGLSCTARRSRSQPYALARGHHVGAQRPPRIVLIRFLEINPMAGKSCSISLGMVMRFTPCELFLLATSLGTKSLHVSEVPPSGQWESGELAPREGRLQFLPIVV